jgi:glycosyltransferase involved in cell wall biosynthesis
MAAWVYRHADAVVGVSRYTAGTFQHHLRIPDDRVFAVHNAIDGATFGPEMPPDLRAGMRRELRVPDHAPVVGCVGRLMRGKDQATLVDAFGSVRERSPDARLIIAGISADIAPDGCGDYQDHLLRRVEALGLIDAVTFTGFLPRKDMPRLYAAFDVLAHPSVEEPFGLVLVEAMAQLRPVVAVNQGGPTEIIRDGVDGVLVPPRQPVALADAIYGLLMDSNRRERLAHAGRARVLAAFTEEIQAEAMLNVYRRVVARRMRRATHPPRPC